MTRIFTDKKSVFICEICGSIFSGLSRLGIRKDELGRGRGGRGIING
jgi:hypothetical protein